jgi:hypothetical protein
MPLLPTLLFFAQFAATLFMTGLIWFVQIVHYPLFATVHRLAPGAGFREYEASHANRTSFVVFPPMAVELLTALAALVPSLRPGFVSGGAAVASAALLLLIWISTGMIQVPLHNRLASNATAEAIDRLVLSNWLRTVLWTARAILLSVALCNALTLSP